MPGTDSLPDPRQLARLGEFMASGYFEEPEASPMRRWSRAVRRRFEHRSLPPLDGARLYPSGVAHFGAEDRIMVPSYSFTWAYNEGLLEERLAGATKKQRGALESLRNAVHETRAQLDVMKTNHTVGGKGYTHSVPNYGRVIREGLSKHARRIAHGLAVSRERGEAEKTDFYLGLHDVVAGVRRWHRRILRHVREAPNDRPEHRDRLVAAFERVPFKPARTFFEAIVAYNFTFYLDDCDNPGRIDQELWPFYERDLAEGRITYEEAVALVRNLWENVDANNGWSAGIGGTTPEGEPAYNELTLVCLEAARSIRRPNLQLHIRRDMPDDCWEATLDTLATGCGLPALYNEEEYYRSLRAAHLGVREEDLSWHNGGGCTETMIHGRSNVGSLDAGINLPLILVRTLDEQLATATSFETLLAAYESDVAASIAEIASDVSADQERKAQYRPQPMRSLLIDDCIDSGCEFNAGGARYNWSVINVAGLANVIDSLAAVREVVFEKRELSGGELLDMLQRDYEGAEDLRKRLERAPRFGNDDPRADDIASEVAGFVFKEFLRYAPWRGGKFLASCLMFVTYAQAGEPVRATPDGRLAGTPIADSAGPVQGRDRKGPTALVRSLAAIPHYLAPGTLVMNARFSKEFFTGRTGRERLKDTIKTYFELGGMQLQINVVDQEVLKDAIEHPERHEDLIIRVGGYSEYFNRLSEALKLTILERSEHGL